MKQNSLNWKEYKKILVRTNGIKNRIKEHEVTQRKLSLGYCSHWHLIARLKSQMLRNESNVRNSTVQLQSI